jgi:diaminohydroxyphosphoribosylaminopyrimidine deaminase/5-amino-6-(5-phosphoribosylamino)uracil reductase
MISDSLWKLLLELKNDVYAAKNSIHNILISGDSSSTNIPVNSLPKAIDILIQMTPEVPPSHWECTVLFVKENGWIHVVQQGKADAQVVSQLLLYLPFCIAPLLTKNRKKALSLSHFAQTLDGHIATKTNQSKWIGNQENLIHAHRIRAVVDAVIIGNKTLLEDQPKLTVRLVEGENPAKVVIGNSDYCEKSLTASGSRVFRITTNDISNCQNENIEYIQLKAEDGRMKSEDILAELHKKGVYSVLIEGGSYTSSIFLNERNIDILQLHISPMLFGSGLKAFNLPSIDLVDECCSFEHHFYHPIGDAIMFTGFVND